MRSLIMLIFFIFHLMLSAQVPMFPTDVVFIGGGQFVLSNIGTKTTTLIDKTGTVVKKWALKISLRGLCISNRTVYVISSFNHGWLTYIILGTEEISFKTERGMCVKSPLINKDGSGVLMFDGKSLFVNDFLPLQRVDVALLGICISAADRYVFVTYNLGTSHVPRSQIIKDG